MIAEILSILGVHDASMMKKRHHPDAAGGGVCEIAGIRTCNVNMPGSCRRVGPISSNGCARANQRSYIIDEYIPLEVGSLATMIALST